MSVILESLMTSAKTPAADNSCLLGTVVEGDAWAQGASRLGAGESLTPGLQRTGRALGAPA